MREWRSAWRGDKMRKERLEKRRYEMRYGRGDMGVERWERGDGRRDGRGEMMRWERRKEERWERRMEMREDERWKRHKER